MPDSDLTKLRRKRIRIHKQLAQLEPMLAGYHAKLAEVEAGIQALAPELPLPARHRRYAPNPVFARGEMPRIVLAIMREAGAPLATREVVIAALMRKGMRHPDLRTWRMARLRVQQVFDRLDKRGVVRKVGTGKATRRALAIPQNPSKI